MRDTLSAIQQILDQRPDVLSAVIFGSLAAGTARPSSDVDLAVDLKAEAFPSAWELGGLVDELSRAVGRRVDLVVLAQVRSSLLRREISKGVLVKGSHEGWVEFRRRAFREWREFAPRFRRYTDAAIRKGLG